MPQPQQWSWPIKTLIYVIFPLAGSAFFGAVVVCASIEAGTTIARALLETLSRMAAPIWLIPAGIITWAVWAGGQDKSVSWLVRPWTFMAYFWKVYTITACCLGGYVGGTAAVTISLARQYGLR